jgi:protein-tyrosine phosphatase
MKNLKTKLSIKIPTGSFSEDLKVRNVNSVKADANHIINEIYLSGYQKGSDYEFLKKNNITHIINCAATSKNFTPVIYDDFTYLSLDIKDEPGFDIFFYIYQCIDFIENANNKNHRKILIHCYEGVSRAPTILSAYLIWKYNYERDYVIKLLKDKRPCVDINMGFLYQLERWIEYRKTQFNSEKVIKLEKSGNITIIDRSELGEGARSNTLGFIYRQGRCLINILSDKEVANVNPNLMLKVERIISLLQNYENFPKAVKNINCDDYMIIC